MVSGRKEIADDGKKTRWKEGESGNPNGRPKLIQTLLKDAQQLSPSQINDVILKLLSINNKELDNIIADPNATTLEILISRAIKKGMAKGDLSQIFSQALNRALGQPVQPIDHSMKDGVIKINVVGRKPEKKDKEL